MIYSLIRPLLFQLDAERAHELGLAVARYIADRPGLARFIQEHSARPRRQLVRVAGMDFSNPIGLAAGLDKNAVAPLAWWAFGFGFAEFGTVTPLPQAGNPRPRLFRLPREKALVNRMGFNNDGAEAVAARLKQQAEQGLRPSFPIGLSVGKNATTPLERAHEDYGRAAAILAPYVDFLTINVSSPNTPNLRTLQDPVGLAPILQAVLAAAGSHPVFVKLAPELEGDLLWSVLDVCRGEGAAGIIATNTLSTRGRSDVPEGGMSGRPLRELALRRVDEIRQHVGDQLAVIGCGGITDAKAAQAMFDAGADLVQIYTGLIYKGPFLPARITRGLKRQALT